MMASTDDVSLKQFVAKFHELPEQPHILVYFSLTKIRLRKIKRVKAVDHFMKNRT